MLDTSRVGAAAPGASNEAAQEVLVPRVVPAGIEGILAKLSLHRFPRRDIDYGRHRDGDPVLLGPGVPSGVAASAVRVV